jgi:hypothetical protein
VLEVEWSVGILILPNLGSRRGPWSANQTIQPYGKSCSDRYQMGTLDEYTEG